MLITVDTFFAAFFLGLLGAGHCLGMCGGIAAALSFALPSDQPARKLGMLLAYNLGRIASYGAIGLLAGLAGWWLARWGGAVYLRVFAGVLLILLGLYLADWWRVLTVLEKGGARLWSKLKPLSDKLLPVKSPWHAMLLGLVWGWLPCGLIYSALAYALASSYEQVAAGGAIMLAFGLGTLPAVFLGGYAATQVMALFKVKHVRWLFALSYILFGCWTVFSAVEHGLHSSALHHQH